MPDPYTDYLNLSGQGDESDPYSDYLKLSDTNAPQAGDPYKEYLNLLTQQQEAITPTKEEANDLMPRHSVGFGGALWEGFKSGLTLGYVADEPLEDMTTGEMSGMLIGELAGALGPLTIASAFTGGFGGVAAGSARMKRAYDIVSLIGKNNKKLAAASKAIGNLDEVGDAAKIATRLKKIGMTPKDVKKLQRQDKLYKDTLHKYKEDYVQKLYKTDKVSDKRIAQIVKAPLYPTASGQLGKSKAYQSAIKSAATHYGFHGANILNKFANSAGAFALTGALRKRGEGTFGELEMADRLSGIPKDMWMGGLFTVAGIPSMLGTKYGNTFNSAALLGLGGFSDYLTGSPSEMKPEERLMHGISLLAFHHIQHGLSNIGVKDKLFNGLKEMGFSNEQALTIAYENKLVDAQMKRIREGETFRYRNLKDKDDWSVIEAEGKRESVDAEGKKKVTGAYINLRQVHTGEIKHFEGKTLSEARNKLHKKYERFDYRDPKLKDDTVLRKDMDFQNRMKDDIVGGDIEKITPEMSKVKEDLGVKRKKVEDVIKKPRTFEIKKKDETEVIKGKKPTIDIRKDIKGQKKWFDEELKYLEKLKNENPDVVWQQFQGNNWPSRYNWMTIGDRKSLRPWVTRKGITWGPSQKDVTPEMIQERIHNLYRKSALKDSSRRVEDNFPAKIKDYKEGDTIVIPKINRHRTSADEGTGKAFDYSESQLGVIVKTNLKLSDGDRYVPVPDNATIRVKTVDLVSNKEFELNIRIGRSRPKGEDKVANLDKIKKDNWKEINKIYDKLEKEMLLEAKEAGMRGKEGMYFTYVDPMGNLMMDKSGRLRPKKHTDIPYDAALERFLRSSGKQEEMQKYSEKLDEYIEPDIASKEFLESEGKINPEMYNTNLFRDASPLVEGKYFRDFYEPEIYTIDGKGNPEKVDLETIGYKGEYIFDDYLEAFRKMEKIWSKSGENEFLGGLKNNLKRQEDKIDTNPDWKRFNDKKQSIIKKLNEHESTNWDRVALISTLYPHAQTKSVKTSIDKLTYKELSRVERFLSKKESDPVHDNNIVSLMPDNMSSKISAAKSKLWNIVREYTLATSSYFEPLGPWGKKIARKLERFSMWRTNVMGTVVQFEHGMKAKLKKHNLTLPEVNENIQIMRDPKYKSQENSKKHQAFLKKIDGVVKRPATKFTPELSLKEWIVNSYDGFFDTMAATMISSNSWIKTITKDGKIKSRRFVQIYDKNGNEIKLIDIYKNPDIHTDQVSSFIQFAKENSNEVIAHREYKHDNRRKESKPVKEEQRKTQEADWKETVEVDRKKSISNYERIYSPRMVSDRFMEISDLANGDSKKAIRDLMEQKEIKELDVPSARKEEIARQMFNEIINMRAADGVYGTQWSRIANLPTHYYLKQRSGKLPWDKNNMEIIQVDNVVKANGELYKKGDKIVDKNNKTHTIDEVVPVYETDYNKVLKKYSDGVAHSTAAAHTYGSPENKRILWNYLADGISRDMSDASYGQFATKVLKNQLFGESRTRFDMIFRPIARVSALTGLSSPVSSVKNVLLGNVQNATVFTTRQLMNNMRYLLSRKNWISERDLARDSGHTHIGSYDLWLAKEPFKGATLGRKIAENAGFMQTTETFNRIFSGPLGMFGMKDSIDFLSGIKTSSNKSLKTSDARRMLIDVLNFNTKEINEMISRRKMANEIGEPMEYKSTEMQKARYRAQLVTQGSGDIPYVPYWMGKQWAKPLTLFYRVAYRMTDTVAKNVVKPIIVDGNMVPAMKYMAGTMGTGYTLYQLYEWILGEERVNKFKSMPNNMLEYFLKAEGLALFSNAFDEHGVVVDSYQPVVFRNTKTFVDMLVGMTKEGFRGEIGFAGKELKDGMQEIVAGYNFYKRGWDSFTGDTQKKFKDSRRRQTQFLDAFYPKEKLDIDFDDGTTSKTAYYRAIRDTYWIDDNQQRAKSYYAALHYLTHTIMAEQGYTAPRAKKEARARLKRVISRMRPVPSSWRKKPGRTRKSKYHEYYTRLPKGAQEQEDLLDSLYIQKKQELNQSIRKYAKLYDTEIY